MKVSELTGVELDYWLLKITGEQAYPSTDWADGGPLIHKYEISKVRH